MTNHSCDECRRGPACRQHNVVLRSDTTIKALRKRRNDLLLSAFFCSQLIESLGETR